MDTLFAGGVLFFTGVSNVMDLLPFALLVNLLGDMTDSSSGVMKHLAGGRVDCAGVAVNGVETSLIGVESLIGVSGSFADHFIGDKTLGKQSPLLESWSPSVSEVNGIDSFSAISTF